MKEYMIYECETCKKTSRDRKEIVTCEAAHIGLTYEEWQEYLKLKNNAAMAGCKMGYTKNAETEAIFDEAVNQLVAFEKKHGILK